MGCLALFLYLNDLGAILPTETPLIVTAQAQCSNCWGYRPGNDTGGQTPTSPTDPFIK